MHAARAVRRRARRQEAVAAPGRRARARVVIGGSRARTTTRRRLRYVFEQATRRRARDASAPRRARVPRARAHAARGRAVLRLPRQGSRSTARRRRSPTPAMKPKLAALESGELDRELAAARGCRRARARRGHADRRRRRARSACSPAARVAAPARRPTRRRARRGSSTRVGTLHVYDGYGVITPPFQFTGTGGTGIPWNGMATFIAGHR